MNLLIIQYLYNFEYKIMCSDIAQMSPVSALSKRYGRVLEAVPVGQPCSTDAARGCMSDPGGQNWMATPKGAV